MRTINRVVMRITKPEAETSIITSRILSKEMMKNRQ